MSVPTKEQIALAVTVLRTRARSYRWDIEDDLVPENKVQEFSEKALALETVAEYLTDGATP